MTRWILLAAVLLLAACSLAGGETPVASLPAAVPTRTAALPTETVAAETATEPTPANVTALDAETTFEVIAAVHAYVLMAGEWSGQGLSLFERQAIIQPVLELGMGPLNLILAERTPDQGLADDWDAATEVYAAFYPLALDWAGGLIDDAMFSEEMDGISQASRQMIEGAALNASPLGINASSYGPGYIGALDVVFALASELDAPVEESFSAQEASLLAPVSTLLAVEVVPFLYPFAGSDVFLVIGWIENIGLQPQQGVEVEIMFFNFLDEHLGTVRGRLLAGTANPGASYPFSASTVTEGEEAALKDWTRYEVIVYAWPAEAEGYQEFELVTTAASQNGSGRFLIEGELTNAGSMTVPAGRVRVGVMAFDAEGLLVGVGDGFVPGENPIAPGGIVPFSAVIEAVSGEPAEFQFFAEYLPED